MVSSDFFFHFLVSAKLTNPAHKGTGMVIKAKELADKHGYFWPNQFENEANAWIHQETTGPEILGAFREASNPIDHFVCSYGTGGTLLGIGRYLRKHSPKTQIHVCEPSNAPLLYSEIPTQYPRPSAEKENREEENGNGNNYQSTMTSFESPHPVWRPHLLQGWATDFIPRLVSSATTEKLYDSVLHVGGRDAIETAKKLARTEGILSGTSGGGTLSAALTLAEGLSESKNIVVIIPDTGERYLSTPLFENIPADMTEEELEIAKSTPSTPPPPPSLPPVTKQATEWVKKQTGSTKVVIFSLEYCEFCWTLTSFLDALGVSYHKIDIDSFIYAKDNIGNQYRAALCEWTGCATFPQFFVSGEFVGGAVDACMMWKNGKLQKLFKKANIKSADGRFNNYSGDPFEFLPKWMTQNPLRSK
jgi:cysteine synthase A